MVSSISIPMQGPCAVGTIRRGSPMSGCAPCPSQHTPKDWMALLLGCWRGPPSASPSCPTSVTEVGFCVGLQRRKPPSQVAVITRLPPSRFLSAASSPLAVTVALRAARCTPRTKALCTCVSLEASEPHRGPSTAGVRTAATCGPSPVCAQPCCGALTDASADVWVLATAVRLSPGCLKHKANCPRGIGCIVFFCLQEAGARALGLSRPPLTG